MRILYLCADRGIPVHGSKGAAAHVRGLVRAFARLGHTVSLVAAEEQPACPRAKRLDEDGLPIEIVAVPAPALLAGIDEASAPRVVRALGHIWMNAEIERVLRERLSDAAPDLIYERYSPFGVAGGIAARAAGIPHILEVNAPLAWEGRQYRRQSLQEAADLLEQTAFAQAQTLVVVSRELGDLLAAEGADAERIVVVPNGVDDELFRPALPRRRAPASPDGGTIVIGFAGSLKPWHGLEILCEAFELLAGDRRFRLLVVGDGPGASLFAPLRQRYPDRIELTGAVPHDEMPTLLHAMDIAVAPYPQLERFYYSPLKLLEYMAAGVPIVASAIGQVPHLIRDGETGLLVTPGDATALSDAILRLAGDAALRARLAERAAREAAEQHSWLARAGTILEQVAAAV